MLLKQLNCGVLSIKQLFYVYHKGKTPFFLNLYSVADSRLFKLAVMANVFLNNQQHEIKIRQSICVKQIKSSFFSNNGNQLFYS